MLCALMLAGAVALQAQYKQGYYDKMDGLKKEALKKAAGECVVSHTRLGYTNLPNYWQYTDVYPELVNGCKRWWDMYSDIQQLIRQGENARTSFSRNGMNREHSVPKSWWKYQNDVEYTPAYSDLWNLYPSDSKANSAKSNWPLGIVGDKPTFDNGVTKVGGARVSAAGVTTVFEPADEYKGDFARAYFYMATVYPDLHWVTSTSFNMFREEQWPTLKPWAYEMLLEWSREDPVSDKEIERNNAVEKQQGNRNPFIDFPNLAEYIWGTRTSQTFLISEQGGSQDPPISGKPEITSPVNATVLQIGQAAVGGSVTAYLPVVGRNFKENVSVRVAGTDKALFSVPVKSIEASTLNHTSEQTPYLIPVLFSPDAVGNKVATLTLYDGGMEGSVAVTLRGEGCEVPVLSRLTAAEATDVTVDAYTANWSPAPEVVDYYVLTVTSYEEDGTENEVEESDTNSKRLPRREGVMQSYSVQSSRLGMLSEMSNSVTVEAYAGLNTVDGSVIVGVEAAEGGVRIYSTTESVDVVIYDLSGRIVYTNGDQLSGSFIALPAGIYIVGSGAMRAPTKLIVN